MYVKTRTVGIYRSLIGQDMPRPLRLFLHHALGTTAAPAVECCTIGLLDGLWQHNLSLWSGWLRGAVEHCHRHGLYGGGHSRTTGPDIDIHRTDRTLKA